MSTPLVLSSEFVQSCIVFARERAQSTAISATNTNFSDLSDLSLLGDYASSASSNPSRYEVSKAEAMFYYAGISPTPPKLVYRTGGEKMPFVMPKGQEAYRRLKQARGVFGHKLNAIWNDVGPKVRDLLIAQILVGLPLTLFDSSPMETVTRRSVVLSSFGLVLSPIRSIAMMPSNRETSSLTSSRSTTSTMLRLSTASPSTRHRLVQHFFPLFPTSTPPWMFGAPLLPLSDFSSLPLTGRMPRAPWASTSPRVAVVTRC